MDLVAQNMEEREEAIAVNIKKFQVVAKKQKQKEEKNTNIKL